MIALYNGASYKLRIEVYKGNSSNLEDFSRADYVVLAVTDNDKIPLQCNIVEGYLSAVLPAGLEPGSVDVRVLWVKDGDHLRWKHNNRTYNYAERVNAFTLTEHQEEATMVGDDKQIMIQMHVATYGYDGLNAYETGLLRGIWQSKESEWLQSKFGMLITDLDIANGAVSFDKLSDALQRRILALENGERFMSVAKPVGKTYNWTGSGITFASETEYYTVSGTTSGRDAGSYQVTYKLKENFIWSDGSAGDVTITYVISAKTIYIPSAQSVTYDGQAHVFASDTDYYTVSGSVSGTNVGEYSVVYTLKDKVNHVWSDGSIGDKTVKHEIKQTMYAYYGTCSGEPASVDTSNFKSLPLSGTLNVTTSSSDMKNCHWVAVKTASGYRVTGVKDVEDDNITSSMVSKVIGDYTVYYILAGVPRYVGTSKFTIVK